MEEKIVKPQMDSTSPAPQAASVSDPAPVDTVKTEAPVAEDEKAGDMTIPSDPYYTSPLFYEVAQYFGLQPEGYAAAKNELSVIVDWAILEGKSNKMEDVLVKLRSLEDKIQPPSWGEKRYSNMYKYIRLASKKASFEKAMSAFERTGARA
jgi:hypothetical protein